ncbi:hypothetical protein [Puia dinghuensis]|uniref:Uncharacterized protein n=1 Tax=Puia dinghuensis TaxID=1792502 RepID=A0A8J2UAX7_9BACT|nr:hypothetical protein [Puia dinghuensis]GGA90806.1 hypothetical protein GCM10011511_12600 [Puia dinghuensis]
MYKTAGSLLFICFVFSLVLRAQDTLPRFSVTVRGPGKILISWHNKYPVVSQISIQRSADSLRNFNTLITVPDPRLPENGATDNKAPHPNFYYRLFIVLDNGKYLFTPSRRPHSQSEEPVIAQKETQKEKQDDDTDESIARAADARMLVLSPASDKERSRIKTPSTIHTLPALALSNTIYVRKGDEIIGQLSSTRIQAFRDSVLRRTKDTLVFINGDTLLIKPFIAKEVYKPSPYIFTGKYGNIEVKLPEAPRKHYAVKFFDENDKLLFELSEIKDPSLTLDKTNFHHSGWFHFELYDGDQLKEKNKFFIPREF